MPVKLLLLSITLLLTLPEVTASTPAADSSAIDTRLTTPFIANRADPWVVRGPDGHYYFTASVPEFDRIEIRKSARWQDLPEAEPYTVWRKYPEGAMSANIWAPELHYIDGAWYLYVAAGEADKPFQIRMYVLKNSDADPTSANWTELGRMQTQDEAFALDATVFEHRGRHYMIWAQQDAAKSYNSALVLAALQDPLTAAAPEVIISKPEFAWETQGYKVNEGAAVLKHQGRIFVSYSASATDHRYAMGLLWADAEADLLNSASWHKAPEPVFTTVAALKRFGPGHNSFVLAEDGVTTLMFYHARNQKELEGSPLTDGNRHTRWRLISWSAQGMPEFANELADHQLPFLPGN